MNQPKYKNKKIIVDHKKFDSKLESNIYLKLLELSKTHNIAFSLQPKYELQPKFKLGDKTYRPIDYVADFELKIGTRVYIIDAKGIETQVFKNKKKQFAYIYKKEIICIKSLKHFVEWFNKEIMEGNHYVRKV